MILGHIRDIDTGFTWLPSAFKRALSYLRDTDWAHTPTGDYEIEGRDIFVGFSTVFTKAFEETRPESHREYIDIQYLITGREKIGVAQDHGQYKISEDFSSTRDLLFYTQVDDESVLTMTPGCFAIFFPNDIHRPLWAVDTPIEIQKAVVKIRRQCLQRV